LLARAVDSCDRGVVFGGVGGVVAPCARLEADDLLLPPDRDDEALAEEFARLVVVDGAQRAPGRVHD
jgi:hypothetical protein